MDQDHPTMYNNMDDQKNKQVSYNKTQFTPEKKQIILEHLLITKKSIENTKNYSHVPCKFFKQGNCTAGNSCPFSHSLDFNEANKRPCKYFKFGNCKFGNKCANSHVLPKSYPATKTTTTNQVSLSSVNYNNNNNRNISIEYKSATLNNKSYLNKNGNIHSFYPHLNNNIMTNNSIYYRPSYNQLISKPSFPLTPPSPPPPFQLSSSSSSSSSSIHSSLSPSIPFSNSYIPKHFNTLYPTDNNCNHISTHISVNNKHTPIMFTKIEEEENINDQPMEESDSNVCHLTYSSILNNLEKEDNENMEEEEEDFQFMYQQSSFNNPTSTQYQQFKFDDL